MSLVIVLIEWFDHTTMDMWSIKPLRTVAIGGSSMINHPRSFKPVMRYRLTPAKV